MSGRGGGRAQLLGVVAIGLALGAVFATAVAEIDGLILESYDPQMVYFFDSLAPFRGHGYSFIDHPGTPLEVLGTALLALTAPFLLGAPEGFVAYHIAHPQVFLTLAYAFLTAGTVATVVLMVRTFSRGLEKEPLVTLLPLALAAACFVPLRQLGSGSLSLWSHNSFSVLGGAGLLVSLFGAARSDEPYARRRLLVVGALAGVLTAVQLYFAAWVIGVSVCSAALARTRHESLLACLAEAGRSGVAAIVGFLVATLPIVPRYPAFASWVFELVTHAQKYGRGGPSVVSPELVADSVTNFWRTEPGAVGAVLGSVALLIAVMAARSRRGAPGSWWALGFGVLALLSTLVLMVLKHPGRHYLPSVVAVVPFVLGLALPPIARLGRWGRALVSVAALATLGAFFLGATEEIGRLRRSAARAREASARIEAILVDHAEALGRPRHDLRVLWGYGTPSMCFGYRMGAAFQDESLFDAEVDRLCPNEWNFDAGRRAPIHEQVRNGTFDWDVLVTRPGNPRLPAAYQSLGTVVPIRKLGGRPLLVILRDRDQHPAELRRGRR